MPASTGSSSATGTAASPCASRFRSSGTPRALPARRSASREPIMQTASTRVLIVDDEPLARERLRTLLADEPGMEVAGEAADGGGAADAIRALDPDLVFLDVQMAGSSGFDVIEQVGADRMPFVVFVTAYDRYALRACDVHALDYLLKPFDRERFRRALERARATLQRDESLAVNRKLLELLDDVRPARKPAPRLVVKTAARVFFL